MHRALSAVLLLAPGLQTGAFAGDPSAATAVRFRETGAEPGGRAEFVAQGGGVAAFFRSDAIAWTQLREDGAASLLLAFEGASPNAALEPGEPLPGRTHDLRGRAPSDWRTDLRSFATLRARGLWPGVDLEAHSRNGAMEIDLDLAPGADLANVVLRVDGAESLAIDASGALIAGALRQEPPAAFELSLSGERRLVPCRYRILDGARYGFEAPGRDASRPLVIDPVLVYATMLGGTGADYAFSVAVDKTGCAYAAGETWSTDFPRAPADSKSAFHGGYKDAFVAKLDVSGERLVYSTLIGGTGDEAAHAVAVDGTGAAYVAGFTFSADFPTTAGAFDATLGGLMDAFALKLAPDGGSFVYATYLGGEQDDIAHGLAIDAAGAAFLTGTTQSTERMQFPVTPDSYDGSANGGLDVFVVKLDPSGARLAYATFLGGRESDQGRAIAVDGQGVAYVTGSTTSADFPSTDAVQSRPASAKSDVFVVRLSATGANLLVANRFGGEDADQGDGIAVDAEGSVLVTGSTLSKGFPTTPGAIDTTWNGDRDAFVVKIPKTGIGFTYSTFLGGKASDAGQSIAVDATGAAYVTGNTFSPDFPRTAGTYDPSWNGASDVFVAKIPAAGNALAYSTYFGGSDVEYAFGIALGEKGDAYIAGTTRSAKFPTSPKAFSTKHAGGFNDAFVVKLHLP